MKKLLVIGLVFLMFSCKKEDKVEEEVAKIQVKLNIERFDKIFYESKPENLNEVKKNYPFFFPEGNEDSVWTNKLSDPLLRSLYKEVQMRFNTTTKLENELKDFFGRTQYYFPKYKTPRVITLINEVDKDNKAIYTDSIVIIALDCYLGKNHPYYVDFPEYERISFEENQIIPDLVNSLSYNLIAPPTDRTLLSLMIYKGKQLFLKDKLIPNSTDGSKIAYTDLQIQWCKENEFKMWSYFVENQILFETNMKNEFRFINDAPFSKFYLDIDDESPGKVGQWLGWQIVRSYMENNSTSLNDMLAMDAKTIFDKSKYKPAK